MMRMVFMVLAVATIGHANASQYYCYTQECYSAAPRAIIKGAQYVCASCSVKRTTQFPKSTPWSGLPYKWGWATCSCYPATREFRVSYNNCDEGYEFNEATQECEVPPVDCPSGEEYSFNTSSCEGTAPSKNDGCPGGDGAGNPCNIATGSKYQTEIDITGELSFIRYYNSRNLDDIGLGNGWRSNYHTKLNILEDSMVRLTGAGRGERWNRVGGVWVGDAESDIVMTETPTGYIVTTSDGAVEEYDSEGKIVSETDRQGRQTTYNHDVYNDRLLQVTNYTGHSLNFTYVDGHLDSVTDADNVTYKYEYLSNNNLTGVVYPTEDGNDNPKRIYRYDNSDFPNHLTGIWDANGDLFAEFEYDAHGRAVLTKHAETTEGVGGQEQFQLNYQ